MLAAKNAGVCIAGRKLHTAMRLTPRQPMMVMRARGRGAVRGGGGEKGLVVQANAVLDSNDRGQCCLSLNLVCCVVELM